MCNPEVLVVFVGCFYCRDGEGLGTLSSPSPFKEMGKYVSVILFSAHPSQQNVHKMTKNDTSSCEQ